MGGSKIHWPRLRAFGWGGGDLRKMMAFPKEENDGAETFLAKKITGLREDEKFICLHQGKWEILSAEKGLCPVILLFE